MPRPLSRRSLMEGLATVLGSTVLACRGGLSGAPEQPQRRLGKITVMQWDPPTTPFGEWLLSYFEAFPSRTGIPLEIIQRKAGTDPHQEQVVLVAAQQAPDVFFRTGRGFLLYAVFASQGVIQPLDSFVKRDKFDLSDFWPGVIALMTAKGKLWVIPQDFNAHLFAYNLAFWRRAGLDAPPTDWQDARWTWPRFVDAAQRLTQRTQAGETAVWGYQVGDVTEMLLWLWTNGGDLLDKEWRRVVVTEPTAVEALDFLQKLIHAYQVAPPPGTALGGGNPFAAERVAMLRAPAALLNVVRGQNPQLEFDVTLFPRGRAGYVAYGGGGGYVMSATTKYPDAAWELLKYIGDREYAVNKVKTGALGPRISTAREFFVQPDKPPQHAPLYFEAHAHAGWEPNITNWIDVQNAVAEEFNQLLANRRSAMETAQAMKQRVEALLPQGEPFI